MAMTVFCKMDLLKSLSTKINIDLLDDNSNNSKHQSDLIDLLLKGVIIKTDKSAQQIQKNLDNPFIKSLVKSNKLKVEDKHFELLSKNDIAGFFRHIPVSPSVMLFYGTSKKESQEFEANYGFHCLYDETCLPCLFTNKLQTFRRDQKIDWNFASDFLSPHNSLIIADPYLFDPISLKSLKEFLIASIPKRNKSKYYITLIGSTKGKNDYNFLRKKILEIQQQIKEYFVAKDMCFEFHFYADSDFHDRYIITNNIVIFSGFGIDIIKNGKAKKDSTWTALKPFNRMDINGKKGEFFYSIFLEKISLMRNWISKSDNKNSSNPLFQII